MPKVSLAFFLVAPIYLLIGLSLGMYMGASDDHSLMPVHAHINLIGFVVMSVMGGFYALAKDHVSTKLAWINFWLLNAGGWVMIPCVALVIKGHTGVIPVLVAGEVLTVLAVATYLFAVFQVWRKKA